MFDQRSYSKYSWIKVNALNENKYSKHFHTYLWTTILTSLAKHVVDVIIKPAEGIKYETLKQRLLSHFIPNRYERAAQLLNMRGTMLGFGDATHSNVRSNMLVLLGDEEPNSLFIQLFLEQLPEAIRKILMHSVIKNPHELANRANTMWTAEFTNTHAVSHSSRGRQDLPTLATKNLYYYHQTGNRATKYQAPCSFKPSKNESADRHWRPRLSATKHSKNLSTFDGHSLPQPWFRFCLPWRHTGGWQRRGRTPNAP